MLSFLLFVLGPMQAARLVTGQHFGYFFGLVLVPAAFLYSRNLFVVGPIAVMTLSSRGLATVSVDGPLRHIAPPRTVGRERGIAEIDGPTSIAEGDARDPNRTLPHDGTSA